MQPEQQQRIMGYFIEEAKDHLNTIEQGVLNLQSTIEDQEMVNELFRAAHSVKGGAAMLGLNSIQQVSHRLEDYFKILKESPVKVDQKLEGLFLQVFDALQELVGQLQGPFGLTEETANATVAGVEPVFGELENHLNVLASNAPPAAVGADRAPAATPATASTAQQDSAFILLFQNDIPLRLREMLQLFKQSELDAANRQQLQDLCRHLISIGEQFDLRAWCNLVELARAAIAHPDNAYRTLAPVVIRDIKQAQELILSGRSSEITAGDQLRSLQPSIPAETAVDDFADLLTADLLTTDNADWLTEPQATDPDALFAGLDVDAVAIDLHDSFNDSFDFATTDAEPVDQHGPEVGMAELNSLADLFEGEVPDLGSTWQEEEIVTKPADLLAVSDGDPAAFDAAADFSDLLFDEAEIGHEAASTSSQDALTDLFADDALSLEPSLASVDRASDPQSDLNALFSDYDEAALDAPPEATAHQSDAAFDAVFGDMSLEPEANPDSAQMDFGSAGEFGSPLDNLGELFAGMDGEQDLTFAALQSSPTSTPVELNLDALDDPFAHDELDEQLFAPSTAVSVPEAPITDPWEQPDQPATLSIVASPDLSLTVASPTDDPLLDESFLDATIASPSVAATGIPATGADSWFGDDSDSLLSDPIEELSDQDDLDFSSLLTPADQPSGAFSLDSPLETFTDVEELTEDGLDQSIATLLDDDSASDLLPADADLASLDLSFSSDAPFSSQPTSNQSTIVSQPDLADPWAVPEQAQTVPDPQFSSTAKTVASPVATEADALSLDRDEFGLSDPELNRVDPGNLDEPLASTDAFSDALNFDALNFDVLNADALNADALEIDFSDFGSDNLVDTDRRDDSDDWLALESSDQTIDPMSVLGDPFAEIPNATAPDAPLYEVLESLPDLDASAFDALSDRSSDSFSDSFDHPAAQPSDTTDALDAFFDEPHQPEDLELPEDLLTIGLAPEPDPGEEAAALTDDMLGLGDLDSLDHLDEAAAIAPTDSGSPSDDGLELGDDLFALDAFTPESLDLAEPTGSNGAAASFDDDLFAITNVDESTDTDSSLEFDQDLLGLESLDSALDSAAALESGSADVELDFGDDVFGFDDPQDDRPTEFNGLISESAATEDFSLAFDDSAFDMEPVPANPDTPTAPIEPRFDAAAEGDAFALAFGNSGFDGSGFDGSGFDGSDFDALTSDAPTDAAASTPELELSDFDWDGTGTENDTSSDLDQLLDHASDSTTTDTPDVSDDWLNASSASDTAEPFTGFDNGSGDALLGDEPDEFAALDSFLASDSAADRNEFAGLESFLDQDASAADPLAELDAFLADTPNAANASPGAIAAGLAAGGMLAFGATAAASQLDDFDDLESLLQGESDASDTATSGSGASTARASEFDELDDLLKDAEEKMGGSPTVKVSRGVVAQNRRPTRPGRVFSEQTMRVPVKHLDNLSNLVGELVVNRNSLEEDQERLRQSLDNLLYQVQQLSDVGQRMQDLYERSLLESSLLASRQSHRSAFSASSPSLARESGTFAQTANATGIEYDPLEMDRFTGFHSLSQEMIELIVRVRESASDIEFIVDETDQVTRMFRQVTTQLQEGLTRSRMVPFAQTADRLPRAVRDIAMKVGKQAELNVEGRETLIDKMILEQLYDPMTHLVNNAITHGIESPEVRRAAGKPAAGRITIRAFHQGNQTIISVSDDGAGIDIERVKIKAVEKGLITAAEAKSMARLDLYDLLFHAGFSTKDQADDFSGRGVGMDVVRTSLSEIRGAINTDSTYGKGTTFTIRLPLTLSISKALCCISDRARIAFPMDGVEDMLDVPKERIQTNADGQACIPWRDSLLPLRPLSELLAYSRHLSRGNVYGGNQEDDIVSIVVLRSAGNFLALQVDQVLGEQEIVIKQLEGPIPKPVGVAGATVLGDGRIMPIADVLELIDLSMGRIRKDIGGSLWEQGGISMVQEAPIAKTEPTVLIVDDSITVRELLSMTFNKVGYRVEQARDGQEAWEKLRAGLPCDIVFCDIEMPRMDGLELLSRIQKDPNLSHLPIAMLTSRGADRHRQMAVSLGASGYFTKPYLEEALLDAAQRMLKGEVLISSSNA